jgi:hypothetical protein
MAMQRPQYHVPQSKPIARTVYSPFTFAGDEAALVASADGRTIGMAAELLEIGIAGWLTVCVSVTCLLFEHLGQHFSATLNGQKDKKPARRHLSDFCHPKAIAIQDGHRS